MSEKDVNRWHNTITPRDKAPQPWTLGSGGSWDMLEVQPIPDAMLSELAQRYHYAGTPWNCRSMPLSASDREYMYLLYSSMQGLVARMRQEERRAAEATANFLRAREWAERAGMLESLLRGVLASEVGRQTLHKLADGHGTDTDEGRDWLAAAQALMHKAAGNTTDGV